MFTASKIKLIYCYLMCLFIGLFFVFKSADLTQTFIKTKYFEETYIIPYSLTKSSFDGGKDRKLTPEKVEHLRLEAIEEDKKETVKRLRNDMTLGLPSLFYSLIFLALHVILIKRTKEQ